MGNLNEFPNLSERFRQVLSASDQLPKESIALYIHIPFCETKCPYCDFNTYASIESLIPTYIDALTTEISLWGTSLGKRSIATIFFGGGTPSYLPPKHIQLLLNTVRSTFSLDPNAEITLESNPGDITEERLNSWNAAGINRLSIGVQSLDDALLKILGRRHTASEAKNAFLLARKAGLKNINLDLMYGLPYQSSTQWQQTLTDILTLKPDHLSIYCLTLEAGTPLEALIQQNAIPDPDPDLAADMYELAELMTEHEGYQQYEISNWALPGYACRHNLVYWRNESYLGVGPGAHSYLSGTRFGNIRSPRRYIQRVEDWASHTPDSTEAQDSFRFAPIENIEAINPRLEMGESMMLGLRLTEGITEEGFKERFGVPLTEQFGSTIRELIDLGLLQWTTGTLTLTPRGRLLGNEVFHRFLS
jgi:oxygen-independent coproporphyrinogen-3 oxidase